MRLNLFSITLVLIIILLSVAPAQYMSSSKLSGVGLPFFHADVFRTFNKDQATNMGLVRIYFQIMNDDLTFIKKDELFTAEVEFDIYLSNESKDYVFNRTVSKDITASDFGETNSREIINTFTTEVSLQPAVYNLIITALDKNNNKQVNRKINFRVHDLSEKDFLVSDVLFFQDYELDSLNRISHFEPNLTNNFSGKDKYFYFYFASIQDSPDDTLQIEYNIRNSEGIVIQNNRYAISRDSRYNKHFVRINRHQFDQSRYELEVKGIYHNQTIATKKRFSFYWTITPQSPKDLSIALEQMRYLLEADSIGWALDQEYEEQLGYFKRFWSRMDPNPNTEKNELMEEYFLRVNIANQNFSTLSQDGWQTDQGRIFIKFGEPDDIERHPFERNSPPFEIWRYYNLRKIFVFLDRTGFGDYYLHPSYLDEEFN